jgi:hypothetical protein
LLILPLQKGEYVGCVFVGYLMTPSVSRPYTSDNLERIDCRPIEVLNWHLLGETEEDHENYSK